MSYRRRVVTVVQNGQNIIDKQEIPGITGGALDSHEAVPGPICLQGNEAGVRRRFSEYHDYDDEVMVTRL
jgi:hypothetical protein